MCCATVVLLATPASSDEVAAYLERNGLRELLAVHLQQQLEGLTGDERADLMLRLADLYAELLEATEDETRRTYLEQRSRRLLEEVPADQADELRIALVRGAYRSAEKIAERHRLRMTAEGEAERATRTLAEARSQLALLAVQLEESIDRLSSRLDRAQGSTAVILSEELDKKRQLQQQCTFLSAWAGYYEAWLADDGPLAQEAAYLFMKLIDPESPHLLPRDVSVDLRELEYISRAILGIALCRSVSLQEGSALEWLELLEHENAFGPLREQMPA